MLVILFAGTCCHGGLRGKKKQMLKVDSLWQLRVSFHRAPWCCVVLWLVGVTNQIAVASVLLPARWVCLSVQQSGPEFTASREKQTSLTLKSSWKTPSIRYWSPVSSPVLETKLNLYEGEVVCAAPSFPLCFCSFTHLRVKAMLDKHSSCICLSCLK